LSFKGGLECGIALALLVITAPFLLIAAALVKLTSPGPAFYAQVRLGRRGKPFRLYKIRTMLHDLEKASGWRRAGPDGPRITRVGRFLRRTHIDELPQLWNVLRGEMSLVGPRSERTELVPELVWAIPHYADRLLVRPGVTGLAQVQLPADTDLASVRRKLAYDLYYIRYVNLWLDLRLMACTGVRMFGVPFHVLCRIFGLPRGGQVEDHYRARLRRDAAPDAGFVPPSLAPRRPVAQSMQLNSINVSGPKESLQKLRDALLAEPQAAQVIITEPSGESDSASPGAVRVRQPWELNEAIWMFAIHFPAGILAHVAYDWVREWLKSRKDAAQVRVQEAPPPSAEGKSGPGN
jgi:lipopolysaccharide/colanic/teichoic acid biosynthesis glycosyltransferase